MHVPHHARKKSAPLGSATATTLPCVTPAARSSLAAPYACRRQSSLVQLGPSSNIMYGSSGASSALRSSSVRRTAVFRFRKSTTLHSPRNQPDKLNNELDSIIG